MQVPPLARFEEEEGRRETKERRGANECYCTEYLLLLLISNKTVCIFIYLFIYFNFYLLVIFATVTRLEPVAPV